MMILTKQHKEILTEYKFSSKTKTGPVAPMMMSGCPEKMANTNPQTDVPRTISDTPIKLLVLSAVRQTVKYISIRINGFNLHFTHPKGISKRFLLGSIHPFPKICSIEGTRCLGSFELVFEKRLEPFVMKCKW